MATVYVLFLIVSSPGFVSGSWGPLTEVSEFATMGACQAAAKGAMYTYRNAPWKPYDDGAICVPRNKP